MKKLSSLFLLIAAAFLFFLIYQDNNEQPSIADPGVAHLPTFPKAKAEWEFSRQANPATLSIPNGALWKAYKALAATRKVQADSMYYREPLPYGWNPVNDFFTTLSITRMVHDPTNPKTFYFSTGEGFYNADAVRGAGVWRSVDGGENWEQLPSTDTSIFYWCMDMAVHPTTGDVYVATREGGLMRSADNGESWEKVLGAPQTEFGAKHNSTCDIEFTKNGGIFVAIGTFNEADGVYYSSTGNKGEWEKRSNGLPSTSIGRIEIAAAPSDANVAYAIPVIDNRSSTDHSKIEGVYRTNDNGLSWTAVNNPGGDRNLAKKQGWYDLTLAVDPNDKDVVVAGGLNIWRSRDGGQNWQSLSHGRKDSVEYYVHVDQHEILFKTSDTVYFGNDGGVWKCDNFTADTPIIYNRNAGYNVTQYYATSLDATKGSSMIIGGTQDNGSSMSTGEGVSDFHQLTWADGSFCEINPQDPNNLYTSKQFHTIFRFKNGPYETHDTIANPYLDENSVMFINPIAMDPNNPQILYQASTKGLWRLNNASIADASEWTQATRPILGEISAIGISKSSPNTIFAGNRIYTSFATKVRLYRIDGADTTDNLYVPVNADPNNHLPSGTIIFTSSVFVDPADANHVLVTYSNYGVKSIFESFNAMSSSPTWQNVEGNLPDIPVYWITLHPADPQKAYIATEMGIFYTEKLDSANTVWTHDSGFPMVRTDMLRHRTSDHKIVAATHGRGMFTAILDSTAAEMKLQWQERGPANVGGRTRTIMIDPNDPSGKTVWSASIAGGLWKTTNIDSVGVKKQEEPVVPLPPEIITSAYAYPNPAADEVHFYYETDKEAQVSLKIYDLRGKLVKIVNTTTKAAGAHTATVNLQNLESGVYLAVLQIGDKRRGEKIVVTR